MELCGTEDIGDILGFDTHTLLEYTVYKYIVL